MMSHDALKRDVARFTYTGVGSRQTPAEILSLMERIAARLASHTLYTLRSGGADGADAAFARGAGAQAEIYLPWRSFAPGQHPRAELLVTGDDPDARAIAASYHPNWAACSRGARALHTRNVHQVLGRNLAQPSNFLLCWTPGGHALGGTATAIKLAKAHNVVVYNLYNDLHRMPWLDWATGNGSEKIDRMFELVDFVSRPSPPAPKPQRTAPRTIPEMTENDIYWKSLEDLDR
jgi:hypothetical protein